MLSTRIEVTLRFLKAAVNERLRSQDGRMVLLQQAGALADDDTLPNLLRATNREAEAVRLAARAQAIRAKHTQENPTK